jgi:hypothetical protein
MELITPQQTLSAARQAGLGDEALKLSGVAVLTFSKAIVDRLEELCALKDAEWISAFHHPYAAAHIVKRGELDELDVTALVPPAAACREREAIVHVGGNATCEALYRITPEMTEEFRRRGCLCMDNGEANTLFAVARTLNILGGVLFQPYIELTQGWDPARLRDQRYRDACRLQAEVVLEASVQLRRQGLLSHQRKLKL